MEAIKKISLFIGILVLVSGNLVAQTTYNTAVVNPPSPNHDVLYGKTGIMAIMGGSYTLGSAALTSMGVNNETPAYMLDILCNSSTPTKNDVNISLTLTSPPPNLTTIQTSAYRIGGYRVLCC